MWPLCSSTRATPLKIITTARLSVHTFMGSKEVFRTKTLPFMLRLILRERGRGCQNYVAGKGFKAREMVRTKTAFAPQLTNASAQVETVAPVVKTSSTRRMFSFVISRG